MKKIIYLIVVFILFGSCKAQKIARNSKTNFEGIYNQKESGEKLELKPDGSYILYNAPVTFTPAIEQCDYASKGQWDKLSDEVLEITSENYYLKQEGFKYELKKESKFSKDSLYIEVNLPDSLMYYKNGIPVNFSFIFNDNVSKSISTNKSSISLPKQKHLWPKTSNSVNSNHIGFSLNANISGTTLYKSRIMFKIFEEDIDTEKYNYLTVSLPHFDLCFFEFEPYNQELIYIKNESQLIWQGKSWEKLH